MSAQQAGPWQISPDLLTLRQRIERHAGRAGLTGERLEDLVTAVNEAASNVLEHAGGQGSVTLWRSETDVVVEITDRLGRLTPRDRHRPKPASTAMRGYGLWLMGRLCDEVTILQAVGSSSVRLRMSTPAAHDGVGG